MSAGLIRSIGGYEGSPAQHPQRRLDTSLRAAGYKVEALELPHNTAPDFNECMVFLRTQCTGLENGVLILHSLSSRLFLLLVDRLRHQGTLTSPCVDTAVLLAPANGRYIADWVPEVASFFTQEVWTPSLTGAARRLLIAASDNDVYWDEASTDLAVFQRQPGVDVLLLEGQGHLNEADIAGDLPDVHAWLLAAKPWEKRA